MVGRWDTLQIHDTSAVRRLALLLGIQVFSEDDFTEISEAK
jgi:hypothetical protein